MAGRCVTKSLGLSREQAANIDVSALMAMIHPEDRSRLQPDADDYSHSGSRVAASSALSGATARSCGGGNGNVEHDASGKPIRQTGIYMDITARKRAEEAQLRSQKLEALGPGRGIAHDFNNVLLAITGNAKLVAEDLPRHILQGAAD